MGALLLAVAVLYWAPDEPLAAALPASFNITRVGIIALDPDTVVDLVASARRVLRTDDVSVLRAINGSTAQELTAGQLPLYLRNVMHWGRSDHMEIYSWPSLACLLSHMALWESMRPNETLAVLEEDAVLTDVSEQRLAQVMEDLEGVHWDVVVLESNFMQVRGVWRRVGKLAATCGSSDCSWQGTRGYIVTARGARRLYEHARPFHVQVDALMGLVATYDPGFRMYWSTKNIALQRVGYQSTLWKACIKCHVPAGGFSFVALFWVITLAVATMLAVCVYTIKKEKNSFKHLPLQQ